MQTKHSTILRILRELREHRDTTVIGQFSSNEMVKHFKDLAGIKPPLDRQAIVKLMSIYGGLCGIYEKDMTLAYYFLSEKQNRFESSYKELRERSIDPNSKRRFIDYVGDHIDLFERPYRRALRNADAHTDIETDDQRGIVVVLALCLSHCSPLGFALTEANLDQGTKGTNLIHYPVQLGTGRNAEEHSPRSLPSGR